MAALGRLKAVGGRIVATLGKVLAHPRVSGAAVAATNDCIGRAVGAGEGPVRMLDTAALTRSWGSDGTGSGGTGTGTSTGSGAVAVADGKHWAAERRFVSGWLRQAAALLCPQL